jgi:hypothetical protein
MSWQSALDALSIYTFEAGAAGATLRGDTEIGKLLDFPVP